MSDADQTIIAPVDSTDGTLRLEIRVAGVARPSASSQALLLRVAEAARLLSLSRAALYPMLGREIQVVRIGRSVRIPREALEKFVAERSDPP